MNDMREKVLTVPNILTVLRLPLAIGVLLDVSLLAKYLCVAAGILMDYLDGYVARRFNQSTKLGAILDPVFDRIFVAVIFAFYFIKLDMPIHFLFYFFIRDVVTVAASVIILLFKLQSRMKIQARFSGKVVTVFQFGVLLLLISEYMPIIIAGFYLTLISSIISLVDYFIYAKKCFSGSSEQSAVGSLKNQ
jgi:cardiolipin synthase